MNDEKNKKNTNCECECDCCGEHEHENLNAQELECPKTEEDKNLIKICELEKEIKELKSKYKKYEEELNKKFLDLIEKKSQEASKILSEKQQEIENKYKNIFLEKQKYLYESQMSDLVEIISQFTTIVNAPVKDDVVKNYLIGFQMYINKFKNLLIDLEINEITPKIDEEFNSQYMNAVDTVEVEESKKNMVLAVYSPAYKLHERIIKLSEVKVGI